MGDIIRGSRGVRDILPDESWKWAYVLHHAYNIVNLFNYSEVHLPIFESTELFSRGIGDATDVVEKEMYTFTDKGGRSITLRPELTASMVRSYLEHGLGNNLNSDKVVKLFGWGPMFRYERPQKGRYRQFYQLDFEQFGSDSPLVDVEVIITAIELFRNLGMKNLEVVLNSVGCPKCRPVYREKLVEYLNTRYDELCPTCKDRMVRSPLRVLDCKICHDIVKDAPDIFDSLCEDCSTHFGVVRDSLTKLGVSYSLDKTLVRGLDYYTKTSFEIKSGDLGSQSAVCGGGRYDNLAETVGGHHVPGVGFAAGLDRIVMVMESQGASFGERPVPKAFIICQDASVQPYAVELLYRLRENGIPTDMNYSTKSMSSQMKAAVAAGARVACIVGGSEFEKQVVTVRDLSNASQNEVALDNVVSQVRTIIGM